MVLQGYLAAMSASSYSYVSMLQHFGPLLNPNGAAVSLTYIASERTIPGKQCTCTLLPAHLDPQTLPMAILRALQQAPYELILAGIGFLAVHHASTGSAYQGKLDGSRYLLATSTTLAKPAYMQETIHIHIVQLSL